MITPSWHLFKICRMIKSGAGATAAGMVYLAPERDPRPRSEAAASRLDSLFRKPLSESADVFSAFRSLAIEIWPGKPKVRSLVKRR
ncbi:protein of unknown function [Candidatus Filomicrobium marinum]|uniref:Uncharacterized protein n=1 Tax=Candidatus Filomicrobium marinum TaxID=1608628 RepID=A0A0D6JFW5_9HYPH|nr:protein of unknown function [Candidatus Filomicrobium marinum]CPR19159.1 protein of unknown function [Candidatus Filomicrobium marinum]